MGGMPVVGKTVGYTIRGARATARGAGRSGRWVTRRVRSARDRGGAGEVGLTRLLDLHAASCAGDTLVTMGLAGTIFFSVPAGEARSRVALYLLVTMAPFALLAPVVGPILDRFRHGRRYALAVTMLGRAFLAWLISDYLHGFGLYPAAFGVLVLSRAYGVARSAAVPRLLPERLRLSEAGARASVFGALAGAVVAPLGVAAFWFGAQWPLRVASLIFLLGTVIALRLPPRADSDPPETLPGPFKLWRGTPIKVLTGRLVWSVLFGSATLRALYGFLALFLAFSVRSGALPNHLFGARLHETTMLGLVAGSLGLGSFLATAVGTRLKIHRPALLQAGSLTILAATALLTAFRASLGAVALLCLVTAIASGLAKLAVDATIQERIREQVRASAFAHSETLLMMAWVLGGALGLIPFHVRLGLGVAAGGAALGALRGVVLAGLLRRERLTGAASGEFTDDVTTEQLPRADRPRWSRTRSSRAETVRQAAGRTAKTTRVIEHSQPMPAGERTEADLPGFHLYRPSGLVPPEPDGDDR